MHMYEGAMAATKEEQQQKKDRRKGFVGVG
jgi:hypothetical protein